MRQMLAHYAEEVASMINSSCSRRRNVQQKHQRQEYAAAAAEQLTLCAAVFTAASQGIAGTVSGSSCSRHYADVHVHIVQQIERQQLQLSWTLWEKLSASSCS